MVGGTPQGSPLSPPLFTICIHVGSGAGSGVTFKEEEQVT